MKQFHNPEEDRQQVFETKTLPKAAIPTHHANHQLQTGFRLDRYVSNRNYRESKKELPTSNS